MEANSEKKEKFILVGVHTGRRDYINDTTEKSMEELDELVKTAGGESVASLIQNRAEVENATYIGEGKLEELGEAVENMGADAVVFDDELSPVQLRNITDALGCKVLDRSMLILDIFAMRAKSGEGKLQVELAQLFYRLPRLRGLGVQMSRTGAGIGTRGPGETRLETDRRHIQRRISALQAEIEEMKKHRELIRNRRKKDGVITAAIVGYTNAGKSTLLNTLTDAGIFAEDKLFATLDPTSRAITLNDNRRILLVDTVGFIRKLPHHLIDAFKSTLEEAAVADFLIHVVDISDDDAENRIKVVESVLSDIGAGAKSVVGVFNKCDKRPEITSAPRLYDENVLMSAKNKTNIAELIKAIENTAPGRKREVTACIPYSMGAVVSELHSTQKVLSEEYTDRGTLIKMLVDSKMYERIQRYCL
ncbi:MAG: GTPase HflX [Firmicutes bacterium]|nr:GTPase HflX [Bacillota bacterium]